MCSLYQPPSDHITRDASVERVNPFCPDEEPLWNVKIDGKVYFDCWRLHIGDPWNRMTSVLVASKEKMGFAFVIKDSYRNLQRPEDEVRLFKQLHTPGAAPGWVRVKHGGDVKVEGRTIDTTGETFRRRKTRLVMESSGESLSFCKDVIHFLKAMYDVLEAHRFGVQHRKILHRDISQMNILIHPEENSYADLFDLEDPDLRPKFIDEVLNKEEKAKPLAILFDLDHACSFNIPEVYANQEEFETLALDVDAPNHISFKSDPLKARTGTPIYIARAVSSGALHYNTWFGPMPVLRGSIRADYELCYANDGIRSFKDEGPGKYHGRSFTDDRISLLRELRSKFECRTVRGRLFRHLPRHDAESTFWVIVSFLLRAKPVHNAVEDDLKFFQKAWKALMTHEVTDDDDDDVDSRSSLVAFDVKSWANALHPALVRLGVHNLLYALAEQVIPEYAWLDKEPHPFHLHEAMQRILLQFIFDKRNEDPILLYTVKVREMIIQEEAPPKQKPAQYRTHDGTGGVKRPSQFFQSSSKRQKTQTYPPLASIKNPPRSLP
ncbi:hypothetical protein HGRIS_005238 [Hohenbuehelia grisea]|uniref:Fungal-type protein kinase domain-containing protein n=1 Tax=Hohenbuehelia grisea TaxID=104357 RepID=A0ABR3JFA1_9AGAR